MMEGVIEKECSALGGLFQTIITDMKVNMLYLFSPACVLDEAVSTKSAALENQLRLTTKVIRHADAFALAITFHTCIASFQCNCVTLEIALVMLTYF